MEWGKWQIAAGKLVKLICGHYWSLLVVLLKSPAFLFQCVLGTTSNQYFFLFSTFQTRFVAHEVLVWVSPAKGKSVPLFHWRHQIYCSRNSVLKTCSLFSYYFWNVKCHKYFHTLQIIFCDSFCNIFLYVISNTWSTCIWKKLHVCETLTLSSCSDFSMRCRSD